MLFSATTQQTDSKKKTTNALNHTSIYVRECTAEDKQTVLCSRQLDSEATATQYRILHGQNREGQNCEGVATSCSGVESAHGPNPARFISHTGILLVHTIAYKQIGMHTGANHMPYMYTSAMAAGKAGAIGKTAFNEIVVLFLVSAIHSANGGPQTHRQTNKARTQIHPEMAHVLWNGIRSAVWLAKPFRFWAIYRCLVDQRGESSSRVQIVYPILP